MAYSQRNHKMHAIDFWTINISVYHCQEAAHRQSICTITTTMYAFNTCSLRTAFSGVETAGNTKT